MDSYISWGKAVREGGLIHAFTGIYFPFQYQIFAGSLGFADAVGLGQIAGVKLVTLAFDVGSLLVLAALLARWGLDRRYAWIYWLSPYFLILNWLGYVDAQMGFLVLLSLYLADHASTARAYLIAGVPLGLAFQMKPQVETVTLMVVVYVAAEMLTRRSWRSDPARVAALVVPAIALFVGYSLYFWSQGAWLLELAKQYSPMYLATQMESLTANMLNFWYPVAYVELSNGARIYTVTGPSVLHLLGTALTVAVFGLAALAAARLPMSFGRRVFVAVALAAMMQPLAITRAHENHFFLGATLGIVLVAALRDRRLTVAFNGFLLVQAAHLVALYGLGVNHLTSDVGLRRLNDAYIPSAGAQTIVAIVAVALSILLVARLFRGISAGALTGTQPDTLPRGRSATTSI